MKKALITGLFFALPMVAAAQASATPDLQPIRQFLGALGSVVSALVPLLIGVALVVFFWGLIRYLWPQGGKSNVAGAKQLMIWGLVVLFVMVSVWGIIRLAQTALGIPTVGPVSPSVVPSLPTVPVPSGTGGPGR